MTCNLICSDQTRKCKWLRFVTCLDCYTKRKRSACFINSFISSIWTCYTVFKCYLLESMYFWMWRFYDNMSVNQAPQVSRLVRLFDSDKSIRKKSSKPAIKGSQTSSQDIQRVGKYLESALSESHSNNVWLFAYGSLVWDSDFEYKERHTGFIHGFKRR